MMSVAALENFVRRICIEIIGRRVGTLRGVVVSYNPADYTARVLYQPSEVLSGFIPVATEAVGMACGLTAGDVVDVVFEGAERNAPYISKRFYSNLSRPPLSQSGEFVFTHKLGQVFKLLNDGTAMISDGHGASITLDGAGNISSSGSWSHTGTIMNNGINIGSTHIHPGVQPGSGVTGIPE